MQSYSFIDLNYQVIIYTVILITYESWRQAIDIANFFTEIIFAKQISEETLPAALPTISVGEVLWKMANHTQGDAPLLPSER